MLEKSPVRDLKWPISVAVAGFSGVITLLVTDKPIVAWKWAVALAPLLLGVSWGTAALLRREDSADHSEQNHDSIQHARTGLLTDIVVPILTALLGSGLIVYLLERPVVASEQVRACEQRHGLQQAQGDVRELPLTRSDRQFGAYQRLSISSCEWPPPSYADDDGFTRIVLVSANGPGTTEATGANIVDRYVSDCARLQLKYSIGTQGEFSHQPPFVATKGTIVDAWREGKAWPPSDSQLGPGDIYPYPGRHEIIVVRNSKIAPDLSDPEWVRCVG